MLNIILSGSPGCGKGTQSALISEKYDLVHLSTGDVLRDEINAGTPLGLEIKDTISKGHLVSDEVMIQLIEHFLDEQAADCKGIIFDGFPRTIVQAQSLNKLLAKRHLDAFLIHICVEEKEVITRLINRGKTSGRLDDNYNAIQERLKVYYQQTEPVCEYYLGKKNYFAVNGNYGINNTFSQIDSLLQLLLLIEKDK